MKNKILSFFSLPLIFLSFLVILPNISLAEVVSFEGGDGSVDNPYQISNCIQLQHMNYTPDGGITYPYLTNGYYFTLNNNIDCSDTMNWNDGAGFMPIGYTYDNDLSIEYGENFIGNFDGQGYIISSLYINRPTYSNVGLFGFVDNSDNEEFFIENIGLVDVNITSSSISGGLVGSNSGHITNAYTTGTVSGLDRIGGLVGYNYEGYIVNSYSTANVTGLGKGTIGGLLGSNSFGHIENTYSTGNVSGSRYVGGLIGYSSGCLEGCREATILNSYATGNVSGTNNVGGLVGADINDMVFNSFYAGVEIQGISGLGGLIGSLQYDPILHNSSDLVFNSGWYISPANSFLLGIGSSADSVNGENITYTEEDKDVFYSKNHGVYIEGETLWAFNGNPWYDHNDSYPDFIEESEGPISETEWIKQQNSGEIFWNSISSNSTGRYLVATSLDFISNDGGYIYTSDDYGETWEEQPGAGVRNWQSVASDSTGKFLVAVSEYTCGDENCSNGDYIYTSKDYGHTWAIQQDINPGIRYSVTSDYTGKYLAVASYQDCEEDEGCLNGGYIYTSDDYGETWEGQQNAGLRYWRYISSDSTGKYLVAVVEGEYDQDNNWIGGYIYTSDDYGETWEESSGVGRHMWSSVATDSSGQYLVATAADWNDRNGGYIYTSDDYGETWEEKINAGQYNWWSVDSSADGQKIIAINLDWDNDYENLGYLDYIYISDDRGDTWVEQRSAGESSWISVTSSYDGKNFAAVNIGQYDIDSSQWSGGYVYTYRTSEDEEEDFNPSRIRSSGSSIGAMSSFYQEQYQRALAVGADTTPYLQALNNLIPTEVIITSNMINPRTLKITSPRMQGEDVKNLQIYLNNHGYNCGAIDSIYGTKTKQSIIYLQQINNLIPDGIVGPKTWAVIN